MKSVVKRCVFLFLFSMLMSMVVSAKEVELVCDYKENNLGIKVYFYDDSTVEGSHYYDGHTINPPGAVKKFANSSDFLSEYQQNKTCPKYALTYQSVNPLQISLAVKYYLFYNENEKDDMVSKEGALTTVNWASLTSSSNPNTSENVPEGYQTFMKTYTARSNSANKMTMSFQYKESNYYRTIVLKSSDVSKNPLMVFKSINDFQRAILSRATNSEWPTDLYCGTLSVTMGIKNHEVIYPGNSRKAKNGDYVCTFDRNLFNGTAYERYTTEGGYLYTPNMSTDPEEPDISVKPSPAPDDEFDSIDSPTDDGIKVSDITLGMVCKSENLKTPLKYIGWLLSAAKIIIPIVIIALGVMDFMKAVASQKQDELSKAIKTVLVRVIAGIIIFLVPAIINFLFTLVDDWAPFDSAYSECTKCLVNPKNC
ncbi:MAG: hypothetical protein HFI09_04950 [Bacilli bacterium]|nr:hypothetical protein [Bacilli bacterium]